MPDPLYHLGDIDFIYSRYTLAIEKFNINIELYNDVDSQDIMRTYYMRGLTYGYMKRFEEAETDFLKIIEWHKDKPLDPKEWALYVDLSWIYFQQGKYEDMKSLIKEGIKVFPDNPWVLNMYGLALLNTGSGKESKPIFEEALAESQKLTEEDWLNAYPGNDPRIAREGLNEMLTAIERNLELVANE